MFNLKLPLYDYQLEAAIKAFDAKYFIVGDSMGLGKTPTALAVIAEVNKPFVVLCPAALKYNWISEIEKFVPNPPKYVVESYSSVHKLKLGPEYRALICDEIHYLKNIKAKRTNAVHSLVQRMKFDYLLGLTGTPIKNNVTEWYSLLSFMGMCPTKTNGKYFKGSYWQFASTFSTAKRTPFGIKYEGIKNIPLLKDLLRGKYIRRLAEKVLDLPDEIDMIVELGKDKKLNGQLEADLQDFLTSGKKTPALATYKKTNAVLKAKKTTEYIKNLIDQGEKVVVFSDHVDSCLQIHQGIKGSLLATGATNSNTRALYVKQFQETDVPCIVCSIGAMSEGHTLTAARHIVFNDKPWSLADYLQAKKRVLRIGQTRKVIVHQMLWGKIDKTLEHTLFKKEQLFKRGVDFKN